MKKHLLLFAALCLPALAFLLLPEQAHAADEDFVSTLVREFYNKTSTWEPTLKRYALIVFRWLLILEVCFLGIKAALNRDQIQDIFKQFVMLILMAGFFMAVINHYQEWCWNLIDGLGSIGKELHLIDCFVRQDTTGAMVRWLYNLYERSLEEGASIQFYMEANLMQDTALDEFAIAS